MGDEFQTRLNHRLAEEGLTGDAAGERTLGLKSSVRSPGKSKARSCCRAVGRLSVEL